MLDIKRGDVCLVDFGNQIGSIQRGLRPAIVVQNDKGNKYSPVSLVVPMTSRIDSKSRLPTHVYVERGKGGIKTDSLVLAEQIQTVNKSQISRVIGKLALNDICKIDHAILLSLGLAM